MGRPIVRAAGIAAATLLIAIGLAAQLGGAGIFGTRASGHTVSVARSPERSQPSPSAKPSPPALASPVAQSVSATGTIYTISKGGGGHKKKHGG